MGFSTYICAQSCSFLWSLRCICKSRHRMPEISMLVLEDWPTGDIMRPLFTSSHQQKFFANVYLNANVQSLRLERGTDGLDTFNSSGDLSSLTRLRITWISDAVSEWLRACVKERDRRERRRTDRIWKKTPKRHGPLDPLREEDIWKPSTETRSLLPRCVVSGLSY